MPTTVASTPAPLPVPVAMSGANAGAPMGVLPIGASLLSPHLNTAGDGSNVQISATSR